MLFSENNIETEKIISKVYCIRRRQRGKHLTFEEREELEAIVEENYSPYATREVLKENPIYLKTPISVRTLSNYIEKEYLLNITKKNLPRKGKSSKRKYTRVYVVIKSY